MKLVEPISQESHTTSPTHHDDTTLTTSSPGARHFPHGSGGCTSSGSWARGRPGLGSCFEDTTYEQNGGVGWLGVHEKAWSLESRKMKVTRLPNASDHPRTPTPLTPTPSLMYSKHPCPPKTSRHSRTSAITRITRSTRSRRSASHKHGMLLARRVLAEEMIYIYIYIYIIKL